MPKSMTPRRALHADELAALRAFAAEYGREWKQYLFAAWLSYAYKGRNMAGRDSGILRTIRNEFGNDWLHKFKFPKEAPVGPWEMSGPEGDCIDQTVVICNNDADQYEVITITEGTVAQRKAIGRKIADLLNEGKAVLN